jgi:hypothetical protein
MDVRICVEGDHADELRALYAWLGEEQELRGQVRLAQAAPGSTQLGAVTDAIVVALGAGGAGTVLVSSLVNWVKTRRPALRLTVEASGRKVELELESVADAAPILKQVLKAVTDD